MSLLRCQKGFTLAELLVALAVLVLVLGAVIGVQRAGLDAYTMGSNRVETQQNLRIALDRLSRDLHRAQQVANPLPTSFTIQTDWNENGLFEPAVAWPDPVDGVLRGEQITWALNGTALQRQEFPLDAAPQTVIGGIDGATGLNFAYPDPQTVVITIRTRTEDNAGVNSAAYTRDQVTTTVRLRNQ